MCSNPELLFAHSLKAIDLWHSWDASLSFCLTAGVDISRMMPYIFDLPVVKQDMFDVLGSNMAYKQVLIIKWINCINNNHQHFEGTIQPTYYLL
jgi:hypothetical protein